MVKMQAIGHIGKDAIVKEVNGKTVVNFSVAHTEKYKNQGGVQMEKTTWVECAYWTDKLNIVPYLTKGMQVYVEGSPAAEAYINKEGEAVATLRLRINTIQLLGSANKGTAQPAQNNSVPAVSTTAAAVDDLPF